LSENIVNDNINELTRTNPATHYHEVFSSSSSSSSCETSKKTTKENKKDTKENIFRQDPTTISEIKNNAINNSGDPVPENSTETLNKIEEDEKLFKTNDKIETGIENELNRNVRYSTEEKSNHFNISKAVDNQCESLKQNKILLNNKFSKNNFKAYFDLINMVRCNIDAMNDEYKSLSSKRPKNLEDYSTLCKNVSKCYCDHKNGK
jgi:hypothetical protein